MGLAEEQERHDKNKKYNTGSWFLLAGQRANSNMVPTTTLTNFRLKRQRTPTLVVLLLVGLLAQAGLRVVVPVQAAKVAISDSAKSSVSVLPSTAAFPPFVSASAVNGSSPETGFTIRGTVIMNSAGFSISNAGDVNGDGWQDVILSATDFNFGGAGAAYVVFGSPQGITTELSQLNGTNGFAIGLSTVRTNRAISVSNAGDVNGDGVDDVVVGAARAGFVLGETAALAHVIFGARVFDEIVSIDELDGLTNGFSIVVPDDSVAGADISVAAAGDVNGDGVDDVIVGDYTAGLQQTGKAHIVWGRANGDFAEVQVRVDWTLEGVASMDGTGIAVDGVGDINGDGLDDVVVGAHMASSANVTESGRAYVVFGQTQVASGSVLALSRLDGKTNGFVLNGQEKGDFTGFSVSRAGDVNADGVADLLVGAPEADPLWGAGKQKKNKGGSDNDDDESSLPPQPILNAGVVHVVYGSKDGFPPELYLGQDFRRSTTIQGRMAGEACGYSVSAAGDVNADGIDDVILGAPQASSSFFLVSSSASNFLRGSAYVLYGSRQFADKALWNVQELVDSNANGARGFVVTGIRAGDQAGWSVSHAGDVNGDGVDDLLVGALLAGKDDDSRFGQVYVLYGRKAPPPPPPPPPKLEQAHVGGGTIGEAPLVTVPLPKPEPTCSEGEAFKVGFEQRLDKTPLVAGDILDESVHLEGGVVFSVHRPFSETEDGMIFDTRHPTGNDANDLGLLPWSKNVLIISKDGNSNDPNDFAHGGVMEGIFPRPVRVKALRLLDIEEEGGRVDLFNANQVLIKSMAIPVTGNGQARLLWLNAHNVARMVITLRGSGALDDVFIKCVAGQAQAQQDGGGLCNSSNQERVMVDFKHLANGLGLKRGDVLDDHVWVTPQLRIQARRKNRKPEDPFMDATIYDAKFPTGQNTQLAQMPWLRQMLIVSGNNNAQFPSPATGGGTVVLDFNVPVYFHGLRLVDVDADEVGGQVQLLDNTGQVLLETTLVVTGSGQQKMLLLEMDQVSQVVILLTGSCAIDDILYCV